MSSKNFTDRQKRCFTRVIWTCIISQARHVIWQGRVVVVVIISLPLSSLVLLLLNHWWSLTAKTSSFRLQYFPFYVCAVPSTAVFFSESIECFPGMDPKSFFKLSFTLPVTPITTGTIIHFIFHICWISIQKLLYFCFFSVSFCVGFLSTGITTSISMHVFSLFILIISGLFALIP